MLDHTLTAAEFTDAALLAEQFARLNPGESTVFCRGPNSWARFRDPAAELVRGWVNRGEATVAFGRDPREPGRYLHRVYRKVAVQRFDGVSLRSALDFEASGEGQLWCLIRDCAVEGRACPSNEALAEALDLESAETARYRFNRLVAQGRLRVIEPARFGPRVVEVIEAGKEPLRTAPSGGGK